jgi:predicted RecA/RadA family phage recombinase
MKEATFYQEGKTIDIELSEAVSVGDVIPLGTTGIAIACTTGSSGETIAADIEGVFEINAKTADAVTAYGLVYFDATNREITITATDNVRAGRSLYAKAGGTAGTVYVKINAA